MVKPNIDAIVDREKIEAKSKEKKFFEGESEAREELQDRVVFINRCSKVVKGGRRLSFSAVVVAGNMKGKVGYGFGKANQVPAAIQKAIQAAKKNLVDVVLRGNTIPYAVLGEYASGKVILKPAAPGTGVIAAGGVRAVVELAGIRDILTKSMGSPTQLNIVKATIAGLRKLQDPKKVRQERKGYK